jgi:hypothetical protein
MQNAIGSYPCPDQTLMVVAGVFGLGDDHVIETHCGQSVQGLDPLADKHSPLILSVEYTREADAGIAEDKISKLGHLSAAIKGQGPDSFFL